MTDTNVLLDLYRLTPAPRTSLLKALGSVADRLWIPHQVGLEFHKMRDVVRSDARRKQTDLAGRITADARKLMNQVGELRKFNPTIDSDDALRSGLISAAERIATELRDRSDVYDEAEEVVLEQLDILFPEQRIGKPFDAVDLAAIRAEAAVRFENKIPPGFADDGKTGDLRYGDFFLWKQLMERAQVMQTGVILITRDEKEDWRKAGQVLPELAYEFAQVTGSNIVVLHPDTFVRESLARNLWQAERDNDVQEVAEEYKRVERAEAEDARHSTVNGVRFLDALRTAVSNYYDVAPRPVLDVNRLTLPEDFLRQVSASTSGINWNKLAASTASLQIARDAIAAQERDAEREVEGGDDSEDSPGESDE
ncbi:PIN-like domain-containing protein [Curtobacterium sp. NPDC086286]|uniref:PIN-like domain-containing protein n=1 Tax=Curtobacterium sp. NPDC086286 TaxID=3363964 RepID=UPI003815B725